MAKEFTELAHAVRNLRRRPTRTAILVAAIGLLVCVLVFALSFVRRVESSIRTASDRLGADVIVVPTGSRGAAEDVLLDNAVKTFYMDRSVADRVRALKGVARVTTQTYLATIPGGCCDVPATIVVAFDPDSDFVVAPWLPARLGRKLGKGEAIVGSESAFNIKVGLTLQIQQVIGLHYRKGQVRTGIALTGLEAVRQGDSVIVHASLERQGNAAYLGTVHAVVLGATGKPVGEGRVPITVFFTNRPRWAVSIAGAPADQYRLRLDITTQREDLERQVILQSPAVRDSTAVKNP